MTATEPLLHEFALRRTRAAEVLERVAFAMADADLDAGELSALAHRARSGRFHVLLIGCFSAGKSTLLNAIVGEPVLPVKVNPCTAILTELVHGPTPEVEIRAFDGTSRTMDVPSFLAEFQLRTTEASAAGSEASDRFANIDRAVLKVPLPLLEDGVVLVDTPGLDDDDRRTERTLRSLPEADAIIFVLNATRFLTDLERRVVRRELLPRGLVNLFFPVTMADLLDALTDDPFRERQEITDRARRTLAPLCEIDGVDRFADRFFLLDARGALTARYDRATATRRTPPDAAALQRTAMPAFVSSLERFLVEERGTAQLGHLLGAARRARADLARRRDLDRATAEASVEELRRRQVELRPRFEDLRAIAKRVRKTVDGFVDRQKSLICQDLRSFLARAEQDLPEAVAGFDLGRRAALEMLTPAGRERVEARVRDQLEAWLAERLAHWQRGWRDRFDSSLDELRVELAGDSRDFDSVSNGIVADFAGGVLDVSVEASTGHEPPPAERWFSVAVGAVLLSPGTMAAGWTEGYEGALKGATSRIGVRLALVAVGALLGPIGWAALVLYAISDAVLLLATGGSQVRRVREHLSTAFAGKLVGQVDQSRETIAERVEASLAPLRDGIVAAAEEDARKLQAQLDQLVVAREAAVQSAEARMETWDRVLAVAEAAVTELEGLAR